MTLDRSAPIPPVLVERIRSLDDAAWSRVIRALSQAVHDAENETFRPTGEFVQQSYGFMAGRPEKRQR